MCIQEKFFHLRIHFLFLERLETHHIRLQLNEAHCTNWQPMHDDQTNIKYSSV